MKTNNEIIDSIEDTFRKSGVALNDDQQAILTGCLFIWLEKAREDGRDPRIKELKSMGEFITPSEANEYCRLHGIEGFDRKANLFTIAGALRDARKDQDKITRNACAEENIKALMNLKKYTHDSSGNYVQSSTDERFIEYSDACQAITNTKAI
ncbi:hypothetical protein KAR91_64275 [Candidatus Pacearchaeota archaeon]|nr:hypothetical protein [Candidatus Pacearchaeota archaeon]